MLKTEHGNELIYNENGNIIDGECIGFICKTCGKNHIASIKRMWEEPYYCSCGETYTFRIEIIRCL